MILKECLDFVKAYGDCFPSGTRDLAGVLGALDKGGGGRWQIGLGTERRFEVLSFRYFGRPDELPGFDARASEALGRAPKAGAKLPEDGLPWLSFDWERESGVFRGARRYAGLEAVGPAGERVAFRAKPFGPSFLADESLKAVFADLAALCPIRELVSQWDAAGGGKARPREGWSLRLERGVPWADFARLTLSAPFSEDSGLFAYLLLNRKVREIEFGGAALTVYLGA